MNGNSIFLIFVASRLQRLRGMPVTKDAAYWTARRAKEKQRLADSGRRKRPRGAAPANMRWDDVRGWVNKDDPHQPAEAAVVPLSARCPDADARWNGLDRDAPAAVHVANSGRAPAAGLASQHPAFLSTLVPLLCFATRKGYIRFGMYI